jgi:hypothetical protein
MCTTLKQDFAPYVPLVYPYVLRLAQTKCDMRFQRSGEPVGDDDDELIMSHSEFQVRVHARTARHVWSDG